MGRTNKKYEGYGETHSVEGWAKHAKNLHNISPGAIRWRLRDNRSIEEVLETPQGGHRPKDKPARSKLGIKEILNSKTENPQGLGYATICHRMNRGLSLSESLLLPLNSPLPPRFMTAAAGRTNEVSWTEDEQKVLDMLRERTADDAEYRRQITLMRRLTWELGHEPGPYSVADLVEWLEQNTDKILDEFKKD